MRSRKRPSPGDYGRLLDAGQLCAYLNIGMNSAMRFADECGAKVKLGKSARYDRQVIDAYISSIPHKKK